MPLVAQKGPCCLNPIGYNAQTDVDHAPPIASRLAPQPIACWDYDSKSQEFAMSERPRCALG